MPHVAIVILNYNGRKYLEQFLPAVLTHSAGHSVWVADNASTDDSLPWLHAHFPEVPTLRLTQNKGYAGGYNEALRAIPADYYVLLNSDVEITPGWVEPVVALLEADRRIAACQPKVLAYHQRTHFEYAGAAGGYLDYLGYPFCRGRIFDTCEQDLGQYNDVRSVFWATGACLFVRASAFQEVGGFDERFFAHMEEIDLCWRWQRAGLRIMYCGQSTVYHVGGGTLHKSNPRKTFLNYRNNLLMLYKNLPARRRWATLLARLVLDGLSSVRFMMAGAWPDVLAILKAHSAFYGLVGALHKEEKARPKAGPSSVALYPRSVVWEYFGKGRKTFPKLPQSGAL
ncbi:glycosyltransferase family 2 protein [Rhabdobacter roseus]|uniref:Glycosyltransferase 2-like domain-containing protein n=1 Tax=Rhabdobacter roseus TaxID=1655419 RepID=A0A840TG94_9BACT|nr:glycosyltransferase family 2 protein [Rhabdobacter roseus]MBB5282231.1 hypothetical protein [Rhabdobacter roseus]